MKIGIVKEIRPDERRVAAAPSAVARLVKAGWEVLVESEAGLAAGFRDSEYHGAGATVVASASEVWPKADVVVKVRPPLLDETDVGEADALRPGAALIAFLFPDQNGALMDHLAKRKATALAMDRIPRISRAQKVDALSSMANIAGYRAVVEAANHFGSFFTGQITAAGKVPPARVLVIGAGVAGLAAIAAAKGLGAIVRAFDVRPAVADQIKSLGAEFLTVAIQESGDGQGGYAKTMSKEFIAAEMDLFRKQAREVDIVITTALIPGQPAPKLWLKDMVELMKPGSVVVDLAAENGGNCELTRPGAVTVHEGVTLIGYTDMPSRMAHVASELFGTNVWHLLEEMGGAAKFRVDHENEIVRGALIVDQGVKLGPPPKKAPATAQPSATPASAPIVLVKAEPAHVANTQVARAMPAGSNGSAHAHGSKSHAVAPPSKTSGLLMASLGILAALVWGFLRFHGVAGLGGAETQVSEGTVKFLEHLTVFVMAVFVGWQVVWNVTPALHTPLMSVTNAISGIIVVGGLLGGGGDFKPSVAVAVVATLFASINAAGGFLVTRRMLAMFRK